MGLENTKNALAECERIMASVDAPSAPAGAIRRYRVTYENYDVDQHVVFIDAASAGDAELIAFDTCDIMMLNRCELDD